MLYMSLILACSSEPTLNDIAKPESYEQADPAPVLMRRLTQTQYKNVLHDVFGDDLLIPNLSEPDSMMGGFLSVGAGVASLSSRGVESLENASYAIAKQVVESETMLNNVLTCSATSFDDVTCATTFIENLGQRMWRRSMEEEEVQRYVAIVLQAASVYEDFNKGLEFGMAALIQSPYFLYRIELGEEDPDNPTQRRYTAMELAHRLSFFLWNRLPDQTLLEAAEDGSLHTREGLFEQAKRMIDDDKAKEGMSNFFTEYLRLYKLKDVTKDPTLFEHYSHKMADDATTETLMLLEYLIFDLETDFRESLTTRTSFVNHRLAAMYNLPYSDINGDFQYVSHPEERHRPGLLGHVSFLALHGHSVSTSATIRGSAVRSIFLCQEIPPAPVDVDTSIPEASGETLTLRDRVAEHLENDSCAGCHLLMDPIGLGFENYDSIGRWRDTDNGAVIDPGGDLDGVDFENPTELATALSEHNNFTWCLTRGFARYANGREESSSERSHLDVLDTRLAHHQYRIKPFLLEMVMSPLFRVAGNLEE